LFRLRHEGGFAVFPSGYRVSKVLVWVVCGLLLIYNFLVLGVLLSNERFYIVNDSPVSVENPFFMKFYKHIPSYISEMEFFPPGFVAGKNHGFLVSGAPLISILLLSLFGLLNHLLYNKGD